MVFNGIRQVQFFFWEKIYRHIFVNLTSEFNNQRCQCLWQTIMSHMTDILVTNNIGIGRIITKISIRISIIK